MSPPNVPPDAAVQRFRGDLESLIGRPLGADERLAVAVSGGADSLALLLLARAAFGDRVSALTVDHGLRPESAGEARFVGEVCARLGVAHDILTLTWRERPSANIQALARRARYRALVRSCNERGIGWLATAHHADDQAETLLLRLARGSGLAGLSGARPARALSADEGGPAVALLRPVLGWRRTELGAIVAAAGIAPIVDPSNADMRYDRTRARRLLGETPWLDAGRLAASAGHLAQANDALDWVVDIGWAGRTRREGTALRVDAEGLPAELQRRFVLKAFAALGADAPEGPGLDRLLADLRAGRIATLGPLKATGGENWLFEFAPPRGKTG